MNTALSIIDAFTPNTDIDYRQEMNVIHEIVAECEKEIAFMHQVHDFVYGDERHNMINRLLRLNHRPDDERTRFNRTWLDQVDLEWVKQNIWAEYWKKVTDMTVNTTARHPFPEGVRSCSPAQVVSQMTR